MSILLLTVKKPVVSVSLDFLVALFYEQNKFIWLSMQIKGQR